MGRVGGCQGQTYAYPVGLAEEGLSFSFLDSWRPSLLVLKLVRPSFLPLLFSVWVPLLSHFLTCRQPWHWL